MSNHCQKVLDLKSVNHEGALLYLRLRDAECQKDGSMRFAARVRCKSDTSVVSDGPAASRFKLKVKPECLQHRERVRGWVQGNLSYDLGKRHNKVVVPEENEFSNLRRLEVHLEKMKDKKEKRYVKNVENLQEFFSSELKSELKASTGQKLMDEVVLGFDIDPEDKSRDTRQTRQIR